MQGGQTSSASETDVIERPSRPAMRENCGDPSAALPSSGTTLTRVVCFSVAVAALACGLDAMITSGFRHMAHSEGGVTSRIMLGKVNADIVITGSSRAVSHYDPRIIEAMTHQTAYNLGRNGSQTDMQIAVLRAYLAHNRKPEYIIHNLDVFSFVTSREVYNLVQYVPYLYEPELYQPLQKINPNIWKSRHLPLYGYVVEDMNFTWITGLKAFFGWEGREDFFLGFNPRTAQWSEDFERFHATHPQGVAWDIESKGPELIEELIRLCQQRGIHLIFAYSPEYREMQKISRNRAEVFGLFRNLAERYQIPLWDYSDWEFAGDTRYFTNSQHLNADGAALFSKDVAVRLTEYLAGRPGAGAERRPELARISPAR